MFEGVDSTAMDGGQTRVRKAGEVSEQRFGIHRWGVHMVGDELMGGERMRIEVFSPTGDEGQRPIPGWADGQVFRDSGFGFCGSFHDDDLSDNTLAKGKDTHKVSMKIHTVTEITKFLIYIKSLGSHVDFYMIMTLKLEEITDRGFKYLIVTVVPNHTNLIQQQKRMGLRDEITKVLYINMTNTGHTHLIHVSVDNPSTPKVLICKLDKKSRLARAFFSENKIQLIGVNIVTGRELVDETKNGQGYSNFDKHR